MERGVRHLLLIAWLGAAAALAQPERPTHVVAPGDTLYALAATYGTTVEELRRLNGLGGDLLAVGAELALPHGAMEPVGYRPYLAGPDATWAGVAVDVGRSVATLRSANPEVPPHHAPAGRLLLVPPAEGVTARARAGDTVAALARRHGIEPHDVAGVNGLDPVASLLPGQPVLLPPGAAVGGAAPAPERHARAFHRDRQRALLAQAPLALVGMTWPDTGFDVPVRGRLSSSFGWRNVSVGGNRFHGGVDIAADAGTPVRVARPGTVERAGWIGAYGYAVYVDHGDGTQTRYAHLRATYVRTGDALLRGDMVGEVGSTGASTGPHLHFEVRIEGRAVDPLAYLELR